MDERDYLEDGLGSPKNCIWIMGEESMKKKKRKVLKVFLIIIMLPFIFIIMLMIFGNGKLMLPVEKKRLLNCR